jgi:hypothetical protein
MHGCHKKWANLAHQNDPLQCAPNQSVCITNEAWRALACICLRKALQIQAFENSPDFTSDKRAPAWCKKSASKALKIFFVIRKIFQNSGKY